MKSGFSSPSQSSEFALVDYLERLAPRKNDRIALVCHLSRLQPYNRRPHHIRVAFNTFENLLGQFEGRMFTMRNNDIVFIGQRAAREKLNEAMVKMRYLFSTDPMVSNRMDDLASATSGFASWYQLDKDFDILMGEARRMYQATQTGQPENFGEYSEDSRTSINPDQLGWLEDSLANADLTNLIRNQPICAVSNNKPTPVFHELYVSIGDLEKQVVPGVDLSGNRWLFQYLTGILDRRMLVYLAEEGERSNRAFSFNMNVATLLSSDFARFDQRISTSLRGRVVIELQTVDVFSDMAAYMFARDYVVDRGYRLCLDGLTHFTAPFIDRNKLAFDFVKIYWTPAMRNADFARITAELKGGGEDALSRVILCRCDGQDAIEVGKQIGINLYQGRHIDKLLRDSEPQSTIRGPR